MDEATITGVSLLASDANIIAMRDKREWEWELDPDDPNRAIIYIPMGDNKQFVARGLEPENARYIVAIRFIFRDLFKMWRDATTAMRNNPQAWELATEGRNFLVVTDEEPFYIPLSGVIRERRRKEGKWTEKDEAFFKAESDRIHKAWINRNKKDGMDTRRKTKSKTR